MRARTRTALAAAAALAAAGPLAAQPPAPASPPAAAAARAYLLKSLTPPAPGLSPDVEVAFADTQVQVALSDPMPANRDALLDAARARYHRALRQNPAHKGALLGLARMAAGLDERDRAVTAFDRYLTTYPADAAAHHEAGIACARFGDWAGAAARCGAAVRLDPESRRYATHLGFCLARAGRWDEAERALARVMSEPQARASLEAVRAHAARPATEPPAPVPVQVRVPVAEPPAAAPVAPAPRELAELTAAYRLRNVAAADVARALKEHLAAGCELATEANAVVVRGSVATHARVAAVVADLDRERPQFVLTTTVLRVDRGFLTASGLARPGAREFAWVLNKREVELFGLALRNYPGREVLSRPQIQVADGQTGHVQVGQDVPANVVDEPTATGPVRRVEFVPTGFSARLTPRLSADGTATLLQVQTQLTEPAPQRELERGAAFPFNVQTLQTTVAVPAGHTVVLAVPAAGADGTPGVVLYAVTPAVVRP